MGAAGIASLVVGPWSLAKQEQPRIFTDLCGSLLFLCTIRKIRDDPWPFFLMLANGRGPTANDVFLPRLYVLSSHSCVTAALSNSPESAYTSQNREHADGETCRNRVPDSGGMAHSTPDPPSFGAFPKRAFVANAFVCRRIDESAGESSNRSCGIGPGIFGSGAVCETLAQFLAGFRITAPGGLLGAGIEKRELRSEN